MLPGQMASWRALIPSALAAGCAALAMSLLAEPASAEDAASLASIIVEPLPWRTNLLSNASFEEARPDGIPIGWHWDRRNTDAVCVTDRSQAHRGRQSILLTNGTGYGAHVYGSLWRAQPVLLTEGKPYTMSAWVKSAAPGMVNLIGGGDWQFRATARATKDQWRRIAKTFVPGPKDCDFTLRINTENITHGVWIDDVKLEDGITATDDPPGAAGILETHLDADEPETVVEGEGAFRAGFTLSNSRALAAGFSAELSDGGTARLATNLAPGGWRVRVEGRALGAGDAPRRLSLRLDDGNRPAAAATTTVRFFSATNALRRLAALKAELPPLQADLAAVKSAGQDVSYPLVTATVLENFIGYAEEDARRGESRRSVEQTGDMERMAARLRGELKEALAGRRQFPAVPRWTGERRPAIRSSSFVGPVRLPGGVAVDRPVFFTGYGHFGKVVSDMEKWPGYGVNIIQIELGPHTVFPAEGQTNRGPVEALARTLDRAQRSGVAVCLLVSPHYFPGWALEKWPHLRKRREGFLRHCLHAPEGQELLRQFIAALMPALKDHPALHSICLANEPVNQEEPCETARRQWRAWLEERHRTLAAVNALTGSNFLSWADVPLPDPFRPQPAKALWMDYIRFNQEFFAEWHRRLAEAVHAAAPAVPVHTKAMTWTLLNDGDVKFGADATLFAGFSDINGNDSVNFYEFGEGEFAQGWQLNAMGHDLQRSTLDAPVFNTENHLIADRDTRPVPAAHIRAALWQAAIHGQSATAIWVWERTFDPKSDFAGSIMHRPACAEAVGIVNHDLNRVALEVTALQQARPHVLLLQSVSGCVWDGGRYRDCLGKLYTALSFAGLQIGFVTERQLEAGRVPDAAALFVPNLTHFSETACAALRQFKGRLVLVGEGDLLTHDDLGRRRTAPPPGERISFRHASTSARQLQGQLLGRFPAWNLRPAVELRGPDRQPAWGVECRSAVCGDARIVNLCNYLQTPATVSLLGDGQPVFARDTLTGARAGSPLTLGPLECRLLRVDSKPGPGR